MMADCVRIFERLPIVEEAQLLRNILYSGVWIRFQAAKEKRIKVKKQEGETVQIRIKFSAYQEILPMRKLKKHIGH